MSTAQINGKLAKEKLLKGVKELTSSVKITLGPKGQNVILEQGLTPLITNDGYTIAKSISLEDKFENLGAKLVFEASAKTNEMAGDGTTTACVLAEALIEEGLKNAYFGVSPMDIVKGMKKAEKVVTQHLEKMARKVKSNNDIKQIATISCEDEEIGSLIAKAFEIVGNDGIISLEESNSMYTTLDVTDGIKLDKGYTSTYFCTNNDALTCEMENPYILVTNDKIDNINQLLPILEQIAQKGFKLVVFATDFADEVTASLVMNKLRGSLNVVAVKSFAYGEQKQEILEDFCTSIGANLISSEKQIKLENATIQDLGQCKKIVITKDNTTIIGVKGDKQKIQERINLIKSLKSSTENDFDKKVYNERLANLQNCVAIIKVGGATDIECNERKLRIEDALSATKSAIEEGIVIGGGCALIKCYNVLQKSIETYCENEKIGATIVLKAIESPLRQIAKNCGQDDGVIVNAVKASNDINYGYDAQNNCFISMQNAGIIDPKKVTRCALQNAISVAISLLTTECAIINRPEK